jgi:hypothetical protein
MSFPFATFVLFVQLVIVMKVFATPTLQRTSVLSLDHEPFSKFNLTCESGESVLLDESILKKSPVLTSIVESEYLESTMKQINIGIKECHQETLNLVYLMINCLGDGLFEWKCGSLEQNHVLQCTRFNDISGLSSIGIIVKDFRIGNLI